MYLIVLDDGAMDQRGYAFIGWMQGLHGNLEKLVHGGRVDLRGPYVTTVHRNASARRRKPAERQSLELADELHGGGDICLG
jgi:hypothetical protein